MAKKLKKQKAGMLKRKQQKQTKKALQRRKEASRPPSKPTSEKELAKMIQRLPTLAYEPELNDLRFEASQMQMPQDNPDLEPEGVKKLASPEFLTLLKERLEQLQARTQSDMQKNLMVKGMFHLLESQPDFHFVNPLIVALYLRSKAELAGEPLGFSQIIKAVEAYETQHKSRLEEMVEAINTQSESPPPETPDEAQPFDALPAPSPVDKNLLETYYQTLSALDEETAERTKEDVEVFVEDFITQPIEMWNAALVDEFLGRWFIKNLNPVADDIASMRKSLEHFFQFLATQEKIPPPEMEKIWALFQNQEPTHEP